MKIKNLIKTKWFKFGLEKFSSHVVNKAKLQFDSPVWSLFCFLIYRYNIIIIYTHTHTSVQLSMLVSISIEKYTQYSIKNLNHLFFHLFKKKNKKLMHIKREHPTRGTQTQKGVTLSRLAPGYSHSNLCRNNIQWSCRSNP